MPCFSATYPHDTVVGMNILGRCRFQLERRGLRQRHPSAPQRGPGRARFQEGRGIACYIRRPTPFVLARMFLPLTSLWRSQ